jgi:hypothetical protein
MSVERARLDELIERERETFRERHPRSRELFTRAGGSLRGRATSGHPSTRP